jgi:hypothetical protein
MEKILRFYPLKTNATPTDDLVQIGEPDLFTYQKTFDCVHISCTFSFDRKEAERLYNVYSKSFRNVSIGGVAFSDPGGEFIPGRYIKSGYVITSRGCPNNCWFCDVPKREGNIRELEIKQGYNVLDSNLLACSDEHIKNVFKILKAQKNKAEFTGGIETARLKEWHIKLFADLKPKQIFFAYDTPNDKEPLFEAGKLLLNNGFTLSSHVLRCYVLIGYKGDTFDKAEKRLNETIEAGFLPMAMLYRDHENNEPEKKWKQYQREWANIIIVSSKIKKLNYGKL